MHPTFVICGWSFEICKKKQSCCTCFSNLYMINDCKSKVCFRVDSCRKRHHTIVHPPSGNTSDGLHNDNHNGETSKPPNEPEAIVHIQIVPHKKPHFFIIHARPISIETDAPIHYGSDTTFLGKDIVERLNVEGTLHHSTVTSALSKSDKIDSALV